MADRVGGLRPWGGSEVLGSRGGCVCEVLHGRGWLGEACRGVVVA